MYARSDREGEPIWHDPQQRPYDLLLRDINAATAAGKNLLDDLTGNFFCGEDRLFGFGQFVLPGSDQRRAGPQRVDGGGLDAVPVVVPVGEFLDETLVKGEHGRFCCGVVG